MKEKWEIFDEPKTNYDFLKQPPPKWVAGAAERIHAEIRQQRRRNDILCCICENRINFTGPDDQPTWTCQDKWAEAKMVAELLKFNEFRECPRFKWNGYRAEVGLNAGIRSNK